MLAQISLNLFELFSKSLKYRVNISKFTAFYHNLYLKFLIFQNAANSECEKNPCECYQFLCPWKKKPCVKIIENFSFPSREKKNPPVKKSYEVSVKNFIRPWKIPKKCAWKPFSIREKSRKKAKKSFHGYFLFSREKKNAAPGAPNLRARASLGPPALNFDPRI